MKKTELVELRRILEEEQKRRERVNELLEQQIIQEFIDLTGKKVKQYNNITKRQILRQILKNYEVSDTNKIYVCTNAWRISFERPKYPENEYEYFSLRTAIDVIDDDSPFHSYKDIESGKVTVSSVKEKDIKILGWKDPTEFIKENIVLNPYNTSEKENGYDEVRMDFFDYATEYGQARAKKMVLDKYPRLEIKKQR